MRDLRNIGVRSDRRWRQVWAPSVRNQVRARARAPRRGAGELVATVGGASCPDGRSRRGGAIPLQRPRGRSVGSRMPRQVPRDALGLGEEREPLHPSRLCWKAPEPTSVRRRPTRSRPAGTRFVAVPKSSQVEISVIFAGGGGMCGAQREGRSVVVEAEVLSAGSLARTFWSGYLS